MSRANRHRSSKLVKGASDVSGAYHDFVSGFRTSRVLTERKFVKVAELAAGGRRTIMEISRITGLKKKMVSNVLDFLGLSTTPKERKISMATRLENKIPGLRQQILELRRSGYSIKKTARLAGVDSSVVSRIEKRVIRSGASRRQLLSANISRALTHPLRDAMRQVIGVKNPDGTYKYPVDKIRQAFGVGGSAIFNANRHPALIRSEQDNRNVYRRFRDLNANDKAALLRELGHAAKRAVENTRIVLYKKLLSLSTYQKIRLRGILLKRAEILPETYSITGGGTKKLVAQRKEILSKLASSSSYSVHRSELRSAQLWDFASITNALNSFGGRKFQELVIAEGNAVRLNPSVVLLLEKY